MFTYAATDGLSVAAGWDRAAQDDIHRLGDVLVVNGHGDTTRAVGLTVYARAVTPAGPFEDGPGSIDGVVAKEEALRQKILAARSDRAEVVR